MPNREFELTVVGPAGWDMHDDNIDVQIVLADGRRYVATFFTMQNIEKLFLKNRETGECSRGLYLWASDMIIAVDLSHETLVATVQGLIHDGELDAACTRIPD